MNFRVHVPATSANLGPGFDSVGLALNLWNRFELSITGNKGELAIQTTGEGAQNLPTDGSHLLTQLFQREVMHLTNGDNFLDVGLRLRCHNLVPPGSGLGSSSTVVLGALLLANAFVQQRKGGNGPLNGPLDMHQILQRAIQLEGHGDNVAAALLGGLVLVAEGEKDAAISKILLPPLRVVVCVPDYHFLTTHARTVLPSQISRQDAIANIGRALLVVDALRRGDLTLLEQVMTDRLHEPYRLPAIPGAEAVKRAARDQGAVAVSLSGAGPGLIAFARDEHEAIGAAMVQSFARAGLQARSWILDTINDGARLEDLTQHQ